MGNLGIPSAKKNVLKKGSLDQGLSLVSNLETGLRSSVKVLIFCDNVGNS